jgi:dTDP-4-dehydrorhamnose reductase
MRVVRGGVEGTVIRIGDAGRDCRETLPRALGPEFSDPLSARRGAIVVLGGAEAYGGAIARICEARGARPLVLGEAELAAVLDDGQASAVIDATTLPLAAAAKRYPGGSFRADVRAGARIAGLCTRAGTPLLVFSSDLVFDGRIGRAALESDPVRPSGSYGASEAEREVRVRAAHPAALVVRTSAVFGLPGGSDEAGRLLADLAAGWSRCFARPDIVSPTYLPDLVHAALDLLVGGETGIRHLVNAGETTWTGFAERLGRVAGLPRPPPAPRVREAGRNTALASRNPRTMPSFDDAVVRYVSASRHPCVPARAAVE